MNFNDHYVSKIKYLIIEGESTGSSSIRIPYIVNPTKEDYLRINKDINIGITTNDNIYIFPVDVLPQDIEDKCNCNFIFKLKYTKDAPEILTTDYPVELFNLKLIERTKLIKLIEKHLDFLNIKNIKYNNRIIIDFIQYN